MDLYSLAVGAAFVAGTILAAWSVYFGTRRLAGPEPADSTKDLAGSVIYFIFEPTRLHLALLSVYGGFTGLVMFIIFAFSDPYAPPGALDPLPLQRLLETEIGGPG